MHWPRTPRPSSRLTPLLAVGAGLSLALLAGCAGTPLARSDRGNVIRDFDALPPAEQGRLARALTAQKARVPGWFDEQRLATGTRGNLRHTALARIVPYDQLERYRTRDFTDRWLFVAVIDSDSAYAKLGLAPTTPQGSPNRLDIQFRSRDQLWIARMRRPAGDSTLFRVVHDPHPADPIPGSARWVWQEDDESAWVMCGAGCCQLGTAMM
jgi:hypothetical protein